MYDRHWAKEELPALKWANPSLKIIVEEPIAPGSGPANLQSPGITINLGELAVALHHHRIRSVLFIRREARTHQLTLALVSFFPTLTNHESFE